MDKMTVQQAIAILSTQFPINWEKITDKPALVTSAELELKLVSLRQLTSPDGSTWTPSIDNAGKVTWQKVEKEEEDGSKIGNE